jgi:hypothetical protein
MKNQIPDNYVKFVVAHCRLLKLRTNRRNIFKAGELNIYCHCNNRNRNDSSQQTFWGKYSK